MSAICALCQKSAKLCRSHVVPEFCYKPIYDGKHRLILVEPTDPDDNWYEQKGARSALLCETCEGFINDRYEKPFRQYWFDCDALAPLQTNPGAVLNGIDYASFKLFHLSVLFRASTSDHPNFREVNLGPHEEQIRRMLLEEDPGQGWQYPILCSAVEGSGGKVLDELVGPAHRIKLYGHWGYFFTFGGAQWFYIVSSRPAPEIKAIRLTQEGKLPVAKLPWLAVEHYQQLRRDQSNW